MIFIGQSKQKENTLFIRSKYRVDQKPKRHPLKKTTEQYKSELINKNIPLWPLEEYKDAKTKILHHCKLCGYKYYTAPSNVLSGRYCPMCAHKLTSNRFSISKDDFVKLLEINNPTVELVGEYTNASTKTTFRCRICGNLWNTCPSAVSHGTGCKSCKLKAANKLKRKTTFQYIEEVKDNKNPNIEIVGEYIDAKTKIQCLCKICNNLYYAFPNDIKRGYGHQKCSNKENGLHQRIANDIFLDRMKMINETISFRSEYQGAERKIDCHCEICGYDWSSYPGNLSKGAGCPKCAGIRGGSKRKQKQAQKYLETLNKMNISLTQDYIDCYTSITHMCNICGATWDVDPHHVLTRGTHCPVCYGSNGEHKIGELLSYYNISFKTQKKFKGLVGLNNGLLSYDFYLPQYNILLEFQGKQHEMPVEFFGGEKKFIEQQEHDKRKRQYALEHGIKLIEIWYYDFDKIEEILTKELNLKSVETVKIA